MVHALESVHRLLVPSGVLIDLRPRALDATLEVFASGRFAVAGFIDEIDHGIEYEQAEAAMAEALGRSLFRVERASTFTFARYAASLADLRADLATSWRDAVIPDDVAWRIESWLAFGGPYAEVVLREHVRIARMRRI